MDRKHQLSFCNQCANKRFDPKRGVICGLTNEYATFDLTCDDYLEDAMSATRIKHQAVAFAEAETRNRTGGLSSLGIKSGSVAGMIILGLGILSVVATIWAFGVISMWSFIPIFIGAALWVKDISAKRKARKENVRDTDSLDGHL